eukprot:jgi/Orpsp1_1/1180643/evm.model.c7180000074196.2
MFQYAFGKSLEHSTGKKVFFDKSWYENSKKDIINDKGENASGVVIRDYKLDIFNLNISFANKKRNKMTCKNKIFEKEDFIYDKELLNDNGSSYYEGYFQNEKYFKYIKNDIKMAFSFPEIQNTDIFNKERLNEIKNIQNSVFIHIRR